MEEYRSRSFSHGHGQMEVYGGGRGGFRSYSTSSHAYRWQQEKGKEVEVEVKKGGKMSSGGWRWNDPELQRKKRVASYKVYSVEGKVKGSFRKSFRWLKDRYTHVLYGWW